MQARGEQDWEYVRADLIFETYIAQQRLLPVVLEIMSMSSMSAVTPEGQQARVHTGESPFVG